ncbi:tRNA pseudouridine(38-40) synthase TruA [Desulfovermiculus halophilus]|uniref:tRNA pseudouridine(38-40) synthase TruA n=1 Tax=Desulfovermiculus halophilus TaxID=339722 RepID=UPI0004852E39|nr:tRNA pseudouridine(38-40) synthase TruA [Desulfovermiculus halophilus]
MPRLKLIVAYTGTHFQGWQVQPGTRTVQGCLQDALSTICSQKVVVHGSGRTDSGVHALGQVAHADVPQKRCDVPWVRALNRMLPEDIAVREAQYVHPGFHAQYSAREKEYVYSLWTHPEYVLPQDRPFVWWMPGVEAAPLREAAEVIRGEHDFAAFQNAGTPVAHTVRRLHDVEIRDRDRRIDCSFTANGFVKQMVRNLMGALVAVGRGKMGIGQLRSLLESRDRRLGPATAPARGLTLVQVGYDPGTLSRIN